MTDKQETYTSIEEIRARFYPMSAPLVDLDPEELVDFPAQLAEESLRTIEQIAASAIERERTRSRGRGG